MRGLLFALPILTALAVLVLAWRGDEPAPVGAQPPALGEPRYSLSDVRWRRLDEQGQVQLVATADRVDWYDDESAQLSGLMVNGLGGEASPWILRAPQGEAPAASRNLRLYGPVTVEGRWPEGTPFEFVTSELWVDQPEGHLRTDTPVMLSGGGRTARAEGLRADWEGKTVELVGHVEVHYDQFSGRERDDSAR